jgi:hypothetical protein
MTEIEKNDKTNGRKEKGLSESLNPVNNTAHN